MKVDLSKVTLADVKPNDIKTFESLTQKVGGFSKSNLLDNGNGLGKLPNQFGLSLNRWDSIGIKPLHGKGKPFTVFSRAGTISIFSKKHDKQFFETLGIKSDFAVIKYKKNKEFESTSEHSTFARAWNEFVLESKKLCK